ncbi:Alpha/Beta hydrolase protein [Trichoderma evansii]
MAQSGQQLQNGPPAQNEQPAQIERHDTKVTQDDAERPIFIVVPGIMGTELLVRDKHYAWNIEKAAGAKYGWYKAKELSIENKLTVGELLDQGLDYIEVPGYGWFLEHLSIYGDVYYYAYDWRHRVQYHVAPCAKGILALRESNPGRRLILIGHSMGGLICRRALSMYDGVEGAITNFVPLGVPVGGSTMAVERAYNGFGWWLPNRRKLTQVLQQFGSIMDDLWPSYPWLREHGKTVLVDRAPPGKPTRPPPAYELSYSWKQYVSRHHHGVHVKGHNVETAAINLHQLDVEADYRAKTVGYHCDKISTPHTMEERSKSTQKVMGRYKLMEDEHKDGDGTVVALASVGIPTKHKVKHQHFVADEIMVKEIVALAQAL